MPPAKNQFSERELQHMAIAFQCLKDPNALQINVEKFAEAAGFQSTGGARNAFGAIKKKLLNGVQTSGSPAATSTKSGTIAAHPSTPGQGNDEANDEAHVNDSEVADNEQTPAMSSPKKAKAKAARKPKAKPTAVKLEAEENAEDAPNEDDSTAAPVTPVKNKRKYTRKPKDPNAPPTKRAKKQKTTPFADDDDAEQADPANNDNTNDEEEEDANTILSGGGKAAVKAQDAENDDDDFGSQTASQEQLAAENILAPNAY